MTYGEIIAKADAGRPNEMSVAEKIVFLDRLEFDLLEMMGLEQDETPGSLDTDTLLPYPLDHVYILLLYTKIDHFNHEAELLSMDLALYNEELSNIRSWWRRNHGSGTEGQGNWRV